MTLWRTLPRHARVVLPAAAVYLALLATLRAAFWAAFQGMMPRLPIHVLAKALYIGLKFDLRLTLLIFLPPALLGWIGPISPAGPRLGRWIWHAYLGIAVGLTGLVYAVDFGNFAYLHARITAQLIDLLADTATALSMVWETYPVIWVVLGLAAAVAIYLALYRRIVRLVAAEAPCPAPRRGRRAALVTLVVVVWIAGIWGKLQWYPLRWSDAFFATDPWSPALALNPLLQLADTLKNRARGFNENATRTHYADVAAYLGVEHPDPAALSFRREVPARAGTSRRPNVVVILLESFAHYKAGVFGNPLHPTPNLDALAREGILFRRFYTPSFGTARSVFTFLTGIPDVEIHETATRNPLIVEQHMIVNAFQGYEKLYFLGGSLNWGNIRGVLAHNIPGLRLFEEGSYTAPRADGWGISDLSLFEAANGVFRQIKDRPFFAVIQTSGHHRPYTIPADNRGFVLAQATPEQLKAAGFEGVDEYNSLRFMDHALGVFLAEARREAYFENTIFVLFGDHGLLGSSSNLPRAEDLLSVTNFHVPFVIVGPPVPGAPRVIDTVASEVDVLPTIASMVGVGYVNTTLGRDLFDPRFDATRYAFTIADHYREPKVGLVTADAYLQIGTANGQVRFVERDGDGTTDVAARNPTRVRDLTTLCRGLFEASRWLMYHNADRAAARPAR